MLSLPLDLTSIKDEWKSYFLSQSVKPSMKFFLILGVLAGALGVTSFSPFNFWPGYFISLTVFSLFIITSSNAKAACFRGASVAFGFFAAGVSWVYVSIAEYGQVGSIIAGIITLIFILALCLFWAFSAWLSWHFIHRFPQFPASIWITLALLLGEFARSTLFTGFPWLLPGYAIEKTWLYELLPIGGIWLSSACVILTASTIPAIVLTRDNQFVPVLAVIFIWSGAAYLHYIPISWVKQTGTLKATLVQGNIKQDEKWLSQTAQQSLTDYQQATMRNLDSDLVVWPETAITYPYNQIKPHLTPFIKELSDTQTTLITGIPDVSRDGEDYYNAIWATGNGFGLYQKQKLVPFGEYIPLADYLGPLLDIFNMPISNFKSGDANQPVLQVGEWGVAPFICYEIVYSEQVRNIVRDSDFLITISNDGWFGTSFGPWQHLQIAQFRAKETGRYLIRATNTGVTAFVNEKGQIVAQAPQFKQATLTAQVKTFTGITPYVYFGYWPTFALLAFCTLCSFLNSALVVRKISRKPNS